MGIVALAHDEILERSVAVKFIRPDVNLDEDLRSFLYEEARAMARVHHPNVVEVHAFGDHDGLPYFVMQYVDGPSVEAWMGATRPSVASRAEALAILEQACLGCAAIHRSGTVHRDLKPSNLLMDGEGNVAVADLGVARSFRRGGDAPTVLVGSAAYMAPEAALGEDTTLDLAVRRDVYALGCMAFELMTGRLPFEASTDVGLFAKHLLEEVPTASKVRPDLPPSLDAVLRRALAKDPWRRYASAGELWTALEAARRDIARSPVSPANRSTPGDEVGSVGATCIEREP